MAEEIRVVQCGLGSIGSGVAREIVSRKGLRLVGAVDPAPGLAGQDLVRLIGKGAPPGMKVDAGHGPLLSRVDADVAVVTTTSSLAELRDQVEPYLRAGLHVVSTCEELAFPDPSQAELAGALDALARERGVALLGTGINPGFLMDLLPIVLSGVCLRILHVRVARIQDAARRRVPFQRKIGVDLGPEEFEAERRSGRIGHVGLAVSLRMIASRLGWSLDRIEKNLTPIIAVSPRAARETRIAPGRVAGLRQVARGIMGEREVARLDFQASVGQEDPRDLIAVEGEPGLQMVIPGGVPGDAGTCAMAVNAVRSLPRAAPGLRTMVDLPPVSCR